MPTNPQTSQRVYTYRRISVGATIATLIFTLCFPAGRIMEPRVNTADEWSKAEVKKITKKIWSTSGKEWQCLDALNTHESQWNWHSRNRKGGAYGIAQALPPTKYNVISTDWKANPMTKVVWQKKYLETRYSGKPCYAWKHERRRGWY